MRPNRTKRLLAEGQTVLGTFCTGASALLKAENLQRVGAFKFRGAYTALAALEPHARTAGVVAFSSGNHAQAVALAGRLLETPATIVMPSDAPAAKLAATRGYGADVVEIDRARALAAAAGYRTITRFRRREREQVSL